MNNKKKAIVSAIIIAIVLMSFICGIVFAKYQTTIKGDGGATVATWSFEANGSDTTVTNVDLASAYDADTLVAGKIAPGTSGSFDIVVNATGSDVAVDYSIKFANEQGKPDNLKFKYENTESSTLAGLESSLVGTINLNEKNMMKVITIYWEWPYETGEENNIKQNDVKDTNAGIAGGSYTFDVIVTGTQVEPQQV